MLDKLISIIVPMYFEEEVAQECYNRLTKVMKESQLNYELIFVNDGSTDKTLPILKEIALKDERAKVISFSRNFGHQNAVTAGIFAATGDALVIIDADLQDPPELIPDLVAKWQEGYDVVYAKRKQRKGETWFKLFTAKCFYKFLHSMSEVEIPKDTGDFRLIDRKVGEVFKNMPERNRFIRGMMSWVGFKQYAFEYERQERFAGSTKYPLKKMLKFASDGIIAFSSKPLKMISYLGGITIFISIILLIYSLIIRIIGVNAQPGWTSIIVAISLFSGVQLLSLGIIGQYIARIYDESKNRPLYIVDEKINFEEKDNNKKEI
ncbi:glycosyltransferase family 2 protein [Inconstantimicrobium mannanitabidum]|uniref:Glycosyl transferase n=1 Tax=Inconstantimicrobium mannanitabidum TaxID=1604901 RepID=A0ACB5R8R9_9CLOT|nr:glycosyltransferase family 2 protein [Clostridium sp. TW13]GKX65419.1 glycosyl transferase [Clostridium sp. TW13]